MRLFLDANVLFTAAHRPRGKSALIIELGGQGYWNLYTSRYAIEEARRNLAYKYPHSLGACNKLQSLICLVEHRPWVSFPDGLAQKDQPIFQAALAARATHLLTGDRKDLACS